MVIKAIKKLFGLGQEEPQLSAEEVGSLRDAFKARYHSFKMLLAANNKALELMSEMERALLGDRPYGMAFIRAHCTGIGVNVFQMVRSMGELAPERYQALPQRFKDIQGRINQELARRESEQDLPLVVSLESVDKDFIDVVGSKMANLGEVRNRVGLATPEGFALTSKAQRLFFQHNQLREEINRRIQATDLGRVEKLFDLSAGLQQLIVQSQLPPELTGELRAAYAHLEKRTRPGVTVSVRSSALGEDAAGTSFAGQYRSQLNVASSNLEEAYKDVVASLYSPQAMSYRWGRGLPDEDVVMCVGFLAMVDAAVGGVTYTRDPLNIRDSRLFLNSAWGLPKSVVDGAAVVDVFVVERGEGLQVAERRIAHKEQKFVCYPEEGVCRLDLTGDLAGAPSLNDEQALALAEAGIRLEEYYGGAQDVEWALNQAGEIVILQCRPLQQQEKEAAAERPVLPSGASPLITGGVAASPGVAAGKVYWVNKDRDALAFPDGAVLACQQPFPRLAALLSRAAAVVAGQGGMAGHMANVAREFGVPALFGLGRAVESLRQDDEVTVDAEGLSIYAGRVEELLAAGSHRKNLMLDSPVAKVMERVIEHVAPLTLIDPDAAEFKAESVQTLHDITRFCHEKSVHEMFSFGKKHHFPERSSKQLYYKVPMQWWIINLDDGYHEEVESKYVHLENIACRAMLALWDGMAAIPWEGPPAMHGRGLASVLFQATTNPNLVPGVKTSYANLNYFMISRNFMSLHSRFGFHFSTVEALVGDRPPENYISFTFKGGAADFKRRLARVHFIADLLEENDFRLRLNEDMAAARVEGLPQAEMEAKLRLLGYLIMHTRQLDMIMSDPAAVEQYRNKMRVDIAKVLNLTGDARP
ncbi:pyruvate water dikinase [Desulfocarbo indianensis]|nr:pyruvate water dikinase [Desulfocarbo indianensis]